MEPGSKWLNNQDGRFYRLLGACRLEATGETHVLYKEWGDGSDFGQWFCRPYHEWNEIILVPGKETEVVRRYTLVKT